MTRVNRASHESLRFGDFSEESIKPTRDMLVNDWGIHGRDELPATLDGMDTGGHAGTLKKAKEIVEIANDYSVFTMLNAYQMDETDYNRFKFVLSNWSIYRDRAIYAWYLGRNVSLCRWGFECGYLSESEAWDKIMRYARKTQGLYASWKEYGIDYYMGRLYWASGFRAQVFLCIRILPNVVEEGFLGGYSVNCQISDAQGTNFSDTVITVDSLTIPYDEKMPYGYRFSRDIPRPYEAGREVTVRVESHFFEPEAITLTVPGKPQSLAISPELPEKGVKNGQSAYDFSWDRVERANSYLIGFVSKVIVSPNQTSSSGLGYHTDKLSYGIGKKDLTNQEGLPLEWLSFHLYALD